MLFNINMKIISIMQTRSRVSENAAIKQTQRVYSPRNPKQKSNRESWLMSQAYSREIWLMIWTRA